MRERWNEKGSAYKQDSRKKGKRKTEGHISPKNCRMEWDGKSVIEPIQWMESRNDWHKLGAGQSRNCARMRKKSAKTCRQR